jgi:hypothetical protein
VGQEEVLSALNGLMLRAGLPTDTAQQALLARILQLEASSKSLAAQIDKERAQTAAAHRVIEQQESARKCCICLSENVTHCLNPCGHTFCGACVTNLPRNRCPNCRSNIQGSVKFFLPEAGGRAGSM